MKRTRLLIALLVLAAAATGAWLYWRSRPTSNSATQVDPYIPIQVRRGELSTDIYATGNVQALRTVNVYSGKTGVVAELFVSSGDEVQEGDVLFSLERDEDGVLQAEAEVRQRRDALTNAKEKLSKIQSLYNAAAATASELREAKAAVTDADEALRSSQLKLDKLVTKNADSVVRATASGVVSTLNAVRGQSITSGSVAAVITVLSDAVVRVSVDEYDVGTVQVGQPAEITFDALDTRVYSGSVSFVSKIGRTQSGVVVYDVDISIDNPDASVRPGMSAEANIVVKRVQNALIVPLGALEMTRGRSMARIYKSDGSVEMREVTVGLVAEAGVEIIDGLTINDMVAVANPRAGSAQNSRFGAGQGGSNRQNSMPAVMPGGAMPGAPVGITGGFQRR
jgi:HlyD family secretion protein